MAGAQIITDSNEAAAHHLVKSKDKCRDKSKRVKEGNKPKTTAEALESY